MSLQDFIVLNLFFKCVHPDFGTFSWYLISRILFEFLSSSIAAAFTSGIQATNIFLAFVVAIFDESSTSKIDFYGNLEIALNFKFALNQPEFRLLSANYMWYFFQSNEWVSVWVARCK